MHYTLHSTHYTLPTHTLHTLHTLHATLYTLHYIALHYALCTTLHYTTRRDTTHYTSHFTHLPLSHSAVLVRVDEIGDWFHGREEVERVAVDVLPVLGGSPVYVDAVVSKCAHKDCGLPLKTGTNQEPLPLYDLIQSKQQQTKRKDT